VRPLTDVETAVVKWFADRIDEPTRHALLRDLVSAQAEEIRDEQLTIRFEVSGYRRPPYPLEHTLPVDAAVLDLDGAVLDVALTADENGRLSELQILRFDPGPVLGPDWSTLRLRRPEEIVRLNSADNPFKV
jgi:hypothetical protein